MAVSSAPKNSDAPTLPSCRARQVRKPISMTLDEMERGHLADASRYGDNKSEAARHRDHAGDAAQ